MLKEKLKTLGVFILLSLSSCGFVSSTTQEGKTEQKAKANNVTFVDRSGNLVAPVTVEVSEDRNGDGVFSRNETRTFTSTTGVVEGITSNSNYLRMVKVTAPGYVPIYRKFKPGDTIPDTFILQKTEKVQVTRSRDGSVSVETDKVEVRIPSGVAGNLSAAEVGYYNPSELPENMPGNFEASYQGDALLSSAGAFNIRFYNSKGNEVELPSSNYQIKFKVLPENYVALEDTDPSTEDKVEIPLWSFNQKTGKWVESGVGYLTDKDGKYVTPDELKKVQLGQENKELYVVGTVKHFSFYNCDIPGKVGALCMKITNLSDLPDFLKKNAKVLVKGKNIRYHGSGTINEDGTVCVPTLVKDKHELKRQKKCPEIIALNYCKVMQDIYNAWQNGEVEDETCKKAYSAFRDATFDYLSTIVDFIDRVAADPNIDENTREGIFNQAHNVRASLISGNYTKACEELVKLNNIYGTAKAQISAEDYMKVVQDLQDKLLHEAIEGLTFIDIPIKNGTVPLGEITGKSILVTFAALENIGEKELEELTSCSGTFINLISNEVQGIAKNWVANSVGQAVQLMADGKKVNVFNAFAESSAKSLPKSFQKNWNDAKGFIINSMFETSDISGELEIKGFNKNNLKCLKDISELVLKDCEKHPERYEKFVGKEGLKKLTQSLGSFSKELDGIINLSEAEAEAIAGKVSHYAYVANLIAHGIVAYLDEMEADKKIKDMGFKSEVDSAVRSAMKILGSLLKNVPKECFTDKMKKDLFGDLDSIPEDCEFTKIAASELYNYYFYTGKGKTRGDSGESDKEMQAASSLYGLISATDKIIDISTILSEVTGLYSPFDQWVEITEEGKIKKFNVTLPPKLQEAAQFSGENVTNLELWVPGVGGFPIEPVNGSPIIAAPGFPYKTPFGNFAAWIGEVRVKAKMFPVSIKLSIPIQNYSVKSINSIILTVNYRNRSIPLNLTKTCDIKGSDISCELTTVSKFFGSKGKIIYSIVIEKKGKTYHISSFQDILLERDINVNLKLYETQVPVIEEILAPKSVEAGKTYTVRVKYRKELRPTTSKPSGTSQEKFKAFLSSTEVGSSSNSEFEITIPDKAVLKSFKGKVPLFVEACLGGHCDLIKKNVEITLKNSPPKVSQISGPDKIEPGQDKVKFSVTASDPDGDTLSFSWKTPPFIVPEGSGDTEELKASVKYPENTTKGRVCVTVSDGIVDKLVCKDVEISGVPAKPVVNYVAVEMTSSNVPSTVKFTVNATSTSGIDSVLVDTDADGKVDKTFKDLNNISFQIEKPGTYTYLFSVKDKKGNISKPYAVTFTVYKSFSVSFNPQGEVKEVSDGSVKVHIDLNVSGIENPGEVFSYLWDLNGDGRADFITKDPQLEKTVDKTLLSNLGSAKVTVSSTVGDFTYAIDLQTNFKPYVSLSCTPTEGNAPLKVTFEAMAYKPGTEVKEFMFDFDGDGTFDATSTTGEAENTYSKPGNYAATLKVVFKDGSSSTTSTVITVESSGKVEYIDIKKFTNFKVLNTKYFKDPRTGGFLAIIPAKENNVFYPVLLSLDKEFKPIKAIKIDSNGEFKDEASRSGIPWAHAILNRISLIVLTIKDNIYSPYSCFIPLEDLKKTVCLRLTKVLYQGFRRVFLYKDSVVSVGPYLVITKMENGQPEISEVLRLQEETPTGIYYYDRRGIIPAVTTDGENLYIARFIYPGSFVIFKVDGNRKVVWKKLYTFTELSLYRYLSIKKLVAKGPFLYIFGVAHIVPLKIAVSLKIDKEKGDLVSAVRISDLWGYIFFTSEIIEDNNSYALMSTPTWGYTDVILGFSDFFGNPKWKVEGDFCNSSKCSSYLTDLFELSNSSLVALGSKEVSSENEPVWGLVGVYMDKESGLDCSYYSSYEPNLPPDRDITDRIEVKDYEGNLFIETVNASDYLEIKPFNLKFVEIPVDSYFSKREICP